VKPKLSFEWVVIGALVLVVGCAKDRPADAPAVDPPDVVPVEAPMSAGPEVADDVPAPIKPVARDPVQAERLFVEARALMDAGNYQEACRKFEESARFELALGVLFNLANCEEKAGRTKAACRRYREVEQMARAKNQNERASYAATRATSLGCK
jgi:tetratricopeptide (TPR) repeat protein